MKKILVAGGAGYVGTHLVHKLVKRKYDVTVVDLMWFGNFLPKAAKIKEKNIMNVSHQELNAEKYDVVVFMAGLSNDPMADFNPSMNFVENSAVPAYLAYAAKRAGISRFIYASSCSIYGYTANELMDEESPVAPQYPYGISKLIGEQAILNLTSKNFRPIILRKGTVGGWSPRMRYDLVVNAMTKTALTEGKIVVHNPNLWRPLIDIDDVATGYIRAIEANLENSGIYNLCYDNYTIGRLADEIKEELNSHGYDIQIETLNRQDIRNYKASNVKAKIELDFVSKTSPRESVRKILANIDPIEDYNFLDKKYYNIQTFKELEMK